MKMLEEKVADMWRWRQNHVLIAGTLLSAGYWKTKHVIAVFEALGELDNAIDELFRVTDHAYEVGRIFSLEYMMEGLPGNGSGNGRDRHADMSEGGEHAAAA